MQSWIMRNVGYFEVILAGICFGFLGVFGRQAFSLGISIGELLTFRFSFAAFVLVSALLILKPALLRLTKKQFFVSSCLGIFGYSVFSTLYFKSLQGVSIAVAAMLLFTFPLFVNLGAYFFLKKNMSRFQWVSLLISSLGLCLLLWGEFKVESCWAIICGLSAAITYSIYVLVSGIYQSNVEPLSSSAVVIGSTAVTLWVFHQPQLERLLSFRFQEYLILMAISIVSTIMPLTLFLSGMQKIESSKASIIVMIEPVTAALAGWVVFGEVLDGYQLTGAIITIFGLMLSML